MKTNPAVTLRPLAVLLLVVGPVLTAAPEPAPAASADKTHVLYMGVDLSIQQGKRFHRIEDVDGSEFVIKVGGENRFVRTRMRANNLKMHPSLKLSPVSVQLDDLQGGPGYTPGNDPRHKFNARSGADAGAQAARDVSQAQLAAAQQSAAGAAANPAGGGSFAKQYEDIISQETANLGIISQQLGSDYGSIGNMANALSLELAEGNYDMVDVSFKISSPEPLDDPYMVVLVVFQQRDAKPGESSLLIHAQSLDPIGPEPRYVRVREGGMPVGFKFERYEVHIYNRGKEVATNASTKRVELTRDEAQLYLVMDHIGENKDATMPATAVPGSLPAALRARLKHDQLERVCYARVSKEGLLLGAYADEGCSLPLADPELVAVLSEAFFKPALAQGKPMDGVARVRLADLTL